VILGRDMGRGRGFVLRFERLDVECGDDSAILETQSGQGEAKEHVSCACVVIVGGEKES
jgi:hypothetical protein